MVDERRSRAAEREASQGRRQETEEKETGRTETKKRQEKHNRHSMAGKEGASSFSGTYRQEEEMQVLEAEKKKNEQIREMGQIVLDQNTSRCHIHLLSIIGEIEGHETAGSQSKTTKYEHVIPRLAMVEDDDQIDGVLILLNTVGGDVEAGLAIAEMIASLSKPTVSLVLGGGHSIGVPLAVSADYTFIVPSATMVIHPVRSNGMVIGVEQTYRNMEKTQDRITTFVSEHSFMTQKRMEELMLDTTQLVKDVGTLLNGSEAVAEGLINEVGGIKDALARLYQMIEEERKEKEGMLDW